MFAEVTNYVLESDSSKSVHHDTIKLNVNLHKTGSDVDVINMWISEEHKLKFGSELNPGFKVLNLETLIKEGEKLEATGQIIWQKPPYKARSSLPVIPKSCQSSRLLIN